MTHLKIRFYMDFIEFIAKIGPFLLNKLEMRAISTYSQYIALLHKLQIILALIFYYKVEKFFLLYHLLGCLATISGGAFLHTENFISK